jgi:beta-galactosidase
MAASTDDKVRIERNALVLGAQRVPLLSGAVHYFRLKPRAWRPALEALKRLGVTMVETYVPWGVHEAHDGSVDFGERDPQKNLGAFLDLAKAVGLHAFVRPGPHINGELTYFGLPARIVFDNECQARSPRGNPLPFIAPPRMFPVPSFASERFLAQTNLWFAEVAKVVRPRLWPDGPVVLLQVDNEAAFYFRDGPYDQDYHPDAVEKYRNFVRRRYTTLDAINEAHGSSYTGWQAVEPPVRFDGATHAALRRQTEFMEWQDALDRMRAALREHGLGGVPTVHNLPMGDAGVPAMLARIDRSVDIAGLDYYHRRHELHSVRERTLRLAGSVRFPCAPEMGVGGPPWFSPRSDTDSLLTALCACAYGVRGMNLYMAVDRDRWYGAPISEDGTDRPHAEGFRKLLSALTHTAFHELTRRVEVAIVLPKEYSRLSRATHTLGALSPTLLDLAGIGAAAASLQDTFGFADPIQVKWPRFVERFARSLTAAGVPYVYIESDAEEARLAGLRVLITPTYELTDTERWRRMCSFAENGGQVVYGPRLPGLDAALQPRTFTPPADATFVDVYEQTDTDRVVHALVAKLGLAQPFPVSPRSVETILHEGQTGPDVLFVVYTQDDLVAAEIALPEPMTLVDALTGERYEGDASIAMSLAGPICRMFVCEKRKSSVPRPKPPSARRSAPPC